MSDALDDARTILGYESSGLGVHAEMHHGAITATMVASVARALVEGLVSMPTTDLIAEIARRNASSESRGAILVEELIAKLAAWLERSAPRIRDECDGASWKVTIHGPHGEDDETLWLEARIDEAAETEVAAGRMPGVLFR